MFFNVFLPNNFGKEDNKNGWRRERKKKNNNQVYNNNQIHNDKRSKRVNFKIRNQHIINNKSLTKYRTKTDGEE